MYAVVDIETTGAYSQNDGITEIGAVITDGKKILDEFHTLLNPKEEIPQFITSLTGITNEMLVDAPYFEEIEQALFDFLQGQIFVAHNVQFDYNFIRNAFERQGRAYNAKRLCTVRLSRKIFTEAPGHSLGKITNYLGIKNTAPHRALGDARATTELLFEIIKRDDKGVMDSYLKSNSHETILPLNVKKDDLVTLPFKPGVYFFINEKGNIIYIGKAKDLKKRVTSHFSGTPNSKRRHHFHTEIHRIEYELTGSDLIASLREDELIRKHWPKYNRAQKKRVVKFGIFLYKDQKDESRIGIQKTKAGSVPIKSFYSEWEAKNWLMEMVREHELNSEHCALPSFLSNVSSKKHEKGIVQLLGYISSDSNTFAFIEEGRDRSEKCLIFIENDAYKGFGFVDLNVEISKKENLLEHIKYGNGSLTSHGIVSSFIEKNSPEIIPL